MLALIAVAVLIACYLLSLRGRAGHPGMAQLRAFSYAHRGLHGGAIPENSMAAFRAALAHGYGIELDIHLLRDGKLAVLHDSSLLRMAGADVRIEDLTAAQLREYPLQGTDEIIPLFSEVLSLYAGKAPLIVELKTAGDNYAELCSAAFALLDAYDGAYCVESFDPRCLLWMKKHRPHVIRGQLAQNWLKDRSVRAPFVLRLALATHTANFILRPDFIAYRFADRGVFGTTLCRRLWGVQGVAWTLRTADEYDTAKKEGWIPIFEGFLPTPDNEVTSP